MRLLRGEGLLIYPTDTVWGLGCAAGSESAVKRINLIKQRSDKAGLIVLVPSVDVLMRYCSPPEPWFHHQKKHADRPTTWILPHARGLATGVASETNELAVRIPRNADLLSLLVEFDGALVSTSANLAGEQPARQFEELSPALIELVDGVYQAIRSATDIQPSRIIRCKPDGSLEVLRN